MCRFVGFVILFLVNFAGSGSAADLAARSDDKPVLNDWFALGSGCKARSDLPGNVDMTVAERRSNGLAVYTAEFRIKDFSLTERQFLGGPKRVGKECAVRLNINPPNGKKIVALRAKTYVLVTKAQGPQLDLLAEFKLGPTSLDLWKVRLNTFDDVQRHEYQILLASGAGRSIPLPQLGCGEPKIIGFDYSWVASNEMATNPSTHVGLSRDHSLGIEAELGDCTP